MADRSNFDHLTSTQVTFQLAQEAEKQGANTEWFMVLARSYNELHPENDYDLDIGIYGRL